MKFKNKLAVLIMTSPAILSYSNYVNAAGNLSGQIGIEVTIGSGCSVANSTNTTSTNTWGSMNFGEYADLANTIDGTLAGVTAGLQVTCTDQLPYALSFDNGLNPSGDLRQLSYSTYSIPYRLYSDISRTAEITNMSLSYTGNGTLQSIPVYGRILPADQGTTAPVAGKYIDTITATLSW